MLGWRHRAPRHSHDAFAPCVVFGRDCFVLQRSAIVKDCFALCGVSGRRVAVLQRVIFPFGRRVVRKNATRPANFDDCFGLSGVFGRVVFILQRCEFRVQGKL